MMAVSETGEEVAVKTVQDLFTDVYHEIISLPGGIIYWLCQKHFTVPHTISDLICECEGRLITMIDNNEVNTLKWHMTSYVKLSCLLIMQIYAMQDNPYCVTFNRFFLSLKRNDSKILENSITKFIYYVNTVIEPGYLNGSLSDERKFYRYVLQFAGIVSKYYRYGIEYLFVIRTLREEMAGVSTATGALNPIVMNQAMVMSSSFALLPALRLSGHRVIEKTRPILEKVKELTIHTLNHYMTYALALYCVERDKKNNTLTHDNLIEDFSGQFTTHAQKIFGEEVDDTQYILSTSDDQITIADLFPEQCDVVAKLFPDYYNIFTELDLSG
jgi:hypothetical protein